MLRPSRLIQFIDARLSRQGNLGRALIKGVLGTAGVRIAHGGIGFIIAILLARMLGPAGYGTYSFVMALVAFLTIPSELGIPGLAVREIAVTNARKEWGYMRGFIVRAHQSIALISLVLILAGIIALIVWGESLDPVKRQCMWLGLVLVPLVALGSLRGAMLRGLRKVVLGQLPEQIVRPLVLLLLILLLPLIGSNLKSAAGVMGVQIIAVSVAFSCGLYLFLKNRPPELDNAHSQYKTAFWLKGSIPFALSASLQLINGRTDILALGLFRDVSEVGVYRVAVQMATLVIFSLQAVNAIQAPHIAHMYAKGDMQRLQTMVTRSSQGILLISAPMVLLFILFGENIIKAAFGVQYEAAYLPLVILCIGQLVNASIGSVASLLNMTGHERETTRSILIGAVVNVVLNFTLTPLWGMIGSAVATASTLIVWNLIMWRKVHVLIGIETSPFHQRRK